MHGSVGVEPLDSLLGGLGQFAQSGSTNASIFLGCGVFARDCRAIQFPNLGGWNKTRENVPESRPASSAPMILPSAASVWKL
jgi:hypothetical protein